MGTSTNLRQWKLGASLATMAALLVATPAFGQATDEDEGDTASSDAPASSDASVDPVTGNAIVVTGIRGALQTARARKRNADTVMDSISATDIGAFPDKSVAEALQRVPGVTVNRFALTTDTAHFTAEPSGVIIRGLPQVRNEFNGRDTFSANSSRGLSWGDVSTELMGGVDVYKNQTADLIEGGIAGSVNLRTRVPFDARGELIQVGVKVNYGDAAKEFTPDVNAYYSNRWNTGIGEIGLMGHAAYSHVKTASLGLQAYRGGIFTGGMLPGSEDVDGVFGPGAVVVPSGGGFLDANYDRKRIGVAAAAQWRSNDQRWLATLQYLRSNYTNEMREHGVSYGLFGFPSSDANFRFEPGASGIPRPSAGTGDFTFGEDGFIDGGVFTETGGWWGDQNDRGMARNASGQAMIQSCYGWGGQTDCDGYDVHAADVGTANRYSQNKSMTQDFGFNLKYEATDNLRLNFDAQFVDSTVELYDASMGFGSFADVEMADLGSRPRLVGFNSPTNINQSEGGLSNPNNFYIANLADNVNDSEGQELALRADGEWDLPSGGFDTIRFGVRFSDRDQEVRNSAYNWQNIANTWTNGCQYLYFNLDSQPGTCDPDTDPNNNNNTTFNGYPAGFYEVMEFGNPFFGGSLGSFPFIPFSFLEDHGLDLFSRERLGNVRPDGSGGVGGFIPICERDRNPGTSYPAELPDSCFAQDELTNVSEETRAAYIMAKFGDRDEFDLGGIRVSGNVGLRYVETRVKSSGFQVYPRITANPTAECPATPLVPGGLTGTKASPNVPSTPGGPPVAPYHAICYLSADDVAFASGGTTGTPVSSNVTYRHFLPSVNLRFDLSDSWLIRAAASRAMSRPDIGLLRNYMSISQDLPGDSPEDDQWIRNAQGTIIGVVPEYQANATNPTLRPTTAWQFDLSLEHYFNNAGMFSFAVFHKSFQNYIQFGRFATPVTNNGVTRIVEGSGPANGPGAKIQGFEIAYNRFFDFLPEPFNGFGMQTNYTYVRNKGIPNASLQTQFPTANPGITLALDPGSLEGLSKHTFNVVGMYEKGPLGARLAYNWRSRYLVTVSDCCVGLPVWQKAAGYLDASIRYNINPNLEVSLEGSNLLNTQTVTMQQLADENSPEGRRILMQNSWFRQDRRFTIGVRWKMGG